MIKFNSTENIIARAKSSDNGDVVYLALKSMFDDLITIRKILAQSDYDILKESESGDIQNLVYPRATLPPVLAQPGKGRLFFDTNRKRHRQSVDTYNYYDVSTPESARLASTVDQAILNNIVTVLTLPTVQFSHMVDVTVANRITVKLDGRYLIGASVRWGANAVGFRQVAIRKNGVTYIASQTNVNAGAAVTVDQTTCTMEYLNTGDYVEFLTLQDSGGNLNILFNVDFSAIGWLHRLG